MADDAAALLGALGIEHAHVLGISMGGMIAQEFAINHPEKVDRLVLLSTYCGGDDSFLGPASANVIRISNLLAERGAWDREMAGMLIPNLLSDEYIEQNPDDVKKWIDRLLIAPTKLEPSAGFGDPES
jgi:pimeloyl-ACP methyl ester carboxylesterase